MTITEKRVSEYTLTFTTDSNQKFTAKLQLNICQELILQIEAKNEANLTLYDLANLLSAIFDNIPGLKHIRMKNPNTFTRDLYIEKTETNNPEDYHEKLLTLTKLNL